MQTEAMFDPTTGAPPPSDDGTLDLERVRNADPSGIDGLYDRYGSAVFALALRIVRDHATAEDVTQETFLGVWKNAARFDLGRGSARTWILSIAHHRAVDAVRRRRQIHVRLEQDAEPTGMPTMPDVWPEVAAGLDRDLIAGALRALPEAQRRCIELAYFEGLTQQEISVATQAPLGTVKSRVRTGLLHLRGVLAATPAEPAASAAPSPHRSRFVRAELGPAAADAR